jgi:hypothetical protein
VLAALAEQARRAATRRYGIGAERTLHELLTAPLPDEAWLRAIGAFGAAHRGGAGDDVSNAPSHEITALLVFAA